MANPNQIRERLKKIRLERQISQATLAKALFVKNTTISNWENGTRSIHLEALHQISEYFNVPLTYFTEVSGLEVTKKNIISNKSVLTASAVIALIVSSGVMLATRNPGMAIDACYGESECYLIEDPQATLELASKNIAGGSMTNVELSLVYDFLQSYLWTEESTYQNSNFRLMIETYLSIFDHDRKIYSEEVYYQFMRYFGDEETIKANDFLKLQSINQDNKQMVVSNGIKHILYKTGFEQFVYEVYADAIYRFTLDLNIKALYFREERLLENLEPLILTMLSKPASKLRQWPDGVITYHHWNPNQEFIYFGTTQKPNVNSNVYGMQAYIYDLERGNYLSIEYGEFDQYQSFQIRKNSDYFAYPYLSLNRTDLNSIYEAIKNFNYDPNDPLNQFTMPFDTLLPQITPYFDNFDFSLIESPYTT